MVLTVSAVLASIAVSQLGGAKANMSRQYIARAFKNSLERARFDSVKRRAADEATMATVTIVNATSYVVLTDQNQNGTLESADSQTVDFSRSSGTQLLLPPGNTAPVTISFDQRGHSAIQDYDGHNVDYFLFCGVGCTASNANPSNSSVIYLSSTGTVALVGGGETLPTITDPTITTVAATDGVNDQLTVWVGQPPTPEPTQTPSASPTPSPSGSPTATATSTATPTATPTGSPYASPTATPTGFPSASPTATPLAACSLNQRPGTPPTCQCNAPWFVGRNGKCGP